MDDTKKSIIVENIQNNDNKYLDNERPCIPPNSHPVEMNTYIMPTNMIFNLYKEVINWIDNRVPGAILYGRPRLGKTKAIEYIMHILPYKYGHDMPIFNILTNAHKNINEDDFFSHYLDEVGHKDNSSGKICAKRGRLISYLVEKVDTSKQNRLIFFIDDAQRLTPLEYGWLMDIYNQLERSGVKMTVILVGQKELLDQRTAFMHAKKIQIIGRFMIEDYQFTGAKSVKDIENCLIGYDKAEFPEDSSWTYTRYFFPDAYLEGFRLSQCAQELYNVFTDIRHEYNLNKKTFDIPMQYLIRTIDYVLRNFGVNGECLNWLSSANWKEAVKSSGYIKAELYQD